MFVDLVGSTAMSTRLDPEEMGELIRLYQNTVAGKMARFDGHLAKFMGDGVLAYFGWPKAHEDEAERAIRVGLAIVSSVARLQNVHQAAARCSGWHRNRPCRSGRSDWRRCRGRRKPLSVTLPTSPPGCKK